MEEYKDHSYVRVLSPEGAYDVGPFEFSGGNRWSDGAVDWLYKQIGLLKTKFIDASLVKHRWNYQEGDFLQVATVDIKVEIAGYTFEILPLKNPKYADVVQEDIEPRVPTSNLPI